MEVGRCRDSNSEGDQVPIRTAGPFGLDAPHHALKIFLFSWLPQPHLQGGPKLQWRDVIRKDLKAISVSQDKWYEEASASRPEWRATMVISDLHTPK